MRTHQMRAGSVLVCWGVVQQYRREILSLAKPTAVVTPARWAYCGQETEVPSRRRLRAWVLKSRPLRSLWIVAEEPSVCDERLSGGSPRSHPREQT